MLSSNSGPEEEGEAERLADIGFFFSPLHCSVFVFMSSLPADADYLSDNSDQEFDISIYGECAWLLECGLCYTFVTAVKLLTELRSPR